jgi:hypothetical protein
MIWVNLFFTIYMPILLMQNVRDKEAGWAALSTLVFVLHAIPVIEVLSKCQ